MTTPYEMRFNYLHFAKEYLEKEYQAELEKIMLCYPDLGPPGISARQKAIDKLKFPTREDIFALAEQIKTFTNKK